MNIKRYLPLVLLTLVTVSCDDYLDIDPPSYVVPEDYYQSEDQIQAAVNDFYEDVLPSHGNWSYGTFGTDADTDNQADHSADGKYADGQWSVPLTDDSNWSWTTIRNINYALNTSLTNLEAGAISGSEANIRHYIGEMYFMRAYSYFTMLKKWGDLPILREALVDDEAALLAASTRSPRNEVARFILEDLDAAISNMQENFDSRRNRVSPDVARLMKSRVALFEASWLKYFSGTPFVPNGTGWPGAEKDYNANYSFPSGSIESEIEYFYEVAAASAETVADKYIGSLTQNTGVIPQSESDVNPYFYMFGATDMSGYPDILQWREYNEGLGITHCVEVAINHGDYGVGLTRSMVEGFVMSDGKPIYATHDGFAYDDTELARVAENTDPRLYIFLKVPGQKNVFKNMTSTKDHFVEEEPYPEVLNSTGENGYSTGYTIRKGGTFDKELTGNGASTNGSITFRATEALLNYMEAQYELTGNINSGKILTYWRAIRTAAGFTGDAVDPMTTINATVMANEANDWGAWSAGELLTDPVLYNIRRERRCELMAEALRWHDLIRWRALDQMVSTPYHIEGFHIWGTPMEAWYDGQLLSDGSSAANMSASSLSEYYRPYEKNMTANNIFRNGFNWHMAHYLYPLPIEEFQLTATDYATPSLSTLYQNPYWPTTADSYAEQ